MSTYKIKKIRLKNFVSFKDSEVDIPNYPGTYIITGINSNSASSNGAGKSSFTQAIIWGLFGVSYRSIIRQGTKQAQVYLALSDGENTIEVLRIKTIKSQKLKIKYNNQYQDFVKKKDAQEFLNKLILNRSNHNLFLNTSFYASYIPFDFINSGSSQKIKIMEELLDSKVLDNAYMISKNKYDEFISIQNKLIAEQSSILNRIKEIQKLISKNIQSSDIQHNIDDNNNKINKNLELMKQYELKQVELNKELQLLDKKIKDKAQSKEPYISKINIIRNKIAHQTELTKLLHDGDSKCPVCGSELTNVKINNIRKDIESILTDLNNQKNELDNIINNINQIIIKMKNELENKQRIYYSYEENKSKLNSENSFLDRNNKMLSNAINNQLKLNNKQLEKYNKKLISIKNKLNKLEKNIEVYKQVKDILSRHSKVRFLLLQQYLNVIADQVLQSLKLYFPNTSNFQIKLDDTKSAANISMLLDDVSIFDLSEGEKNVVRIALILSFVYTFFVLYGSKLGLLIFDEVFSSFDSQNSSSTINLLNDFSQKLGLQIFIIYHGNIDLDLFTHNIIVSKNNNESTVEVN